MPRSERRRVAGLDPGEIPRAHRGRPLGLGAAVHYPQDFHGPYGRAIVYLGRSKALELAENWAKWFHRWTSAFSRREDGFDHGLRDRRHARDLGGAFRHHREAGVPRAHGPLHAPKALRPAPRGLGPSVQYAREHDHTRDTRRGPRLRGHGRGALARHREGLLGARGREASPLRHGRRHDGRDVGAGGAAAASSRRQEPGALHGLQHDAPRGVPPQAHGRSALCRLLGAEPAQRGPRAGLLEGEPRRTERRPTIHSPASCPTSCPFVPAR